MAVGKITKAELVDSIYEQTGMARKDIRTVADLLIIELKKSLVDGYSIELRGFGTFEIRTRKGRRKARNPRTGEEVLVRSHGIAAFRPGRELKVAVWNRKSREELSPEVPDTMVDLDDEGYEGT